MFLISIYASDAPIVILSTTVEGNSRLSKDDIIRNSRLFKGVAINGDAIQKGIKRLYKLDRFKDIQISVLSEEENGINILIYVEEYPVLDKINFINNTKQSSKKLKENISLQKGQIITDNNDISCN